MSQQEESNLERRVVALELALNDLYDRLARDEAKLAAAYTQSLMGGSGSGGGGSTPICWAEAKTGIGAAAVTGTVGARTLTPNSATCDIYAFNSSNNTWYYLGSAAVYNDYPGSTGVTVGHWVQIYMDQYNNYRVLGEQCS